MKKNLLLVVCAFLICASSTSVFALNAKRVGHGVWYAALTGTSVAAVFSIVGCAYEEKKSFTNALFVIAALIPCGYGVHGGIKGLAAVYHGDEYKDEVDVDTV